MDETKYRLLDVGDYYRDGDEILTVGNGWQSISGFGTVQAHTVPMRRPDDGKGKWVLCDMPEFSGIYDFANVEYWRWGVGWVRWTPETIRDHYRDTVWRKERKVKQILCPAPRFYPNTDHRFVVLCPDGRVVIPTKALGGEFDNACKQAKRLAEIESKHNVEYQVAEVVRTFKCIVEVVEHINKEMSK